ncbi:MAG: OsmC family protein [Bacteroidota bacterium]
MTKTEIEYRGGLRTVLTHTPSGEQLTTDAPTDNHGKGEAFSPTDLIAASLISCMVTVMGIQADKRGMNMGEVTGSVEKVMVTNPRRVGQLNIKIDFAKHNLSGADRQALEHAAINCPVAQSLSPDIVQQAQFTYD